MTLIAETGAGVASANSYAAIASIDAHWLARPHNPLATAWAEADDDVKQGAAVEATQYLDDMLVSAYRGRRAGYVQGLEWPRIDAFDDSGFDLPDLPPQLVAAVCELSARALTDRLSQDAELDGSIKRIQQGVDVISEAIEYMNGASTEAKYGLVLRSLAPILNGTQPNAPASWAFC